MRIGLDIRVVTASRTGMGNYTLRLLEGLKETAPELELILLAQPANLEALPPGLRAGPVLHTRLAHQSHPWGDLWEHLVLPRLLARHRVELLHGPAMLAPLGRGPCKRVVTIHDLVAFLAPETVPWRYARYMRWLLRRLVHSVDHIISDSQSTKQDLQQVLGVEPERVSVVPLAADPMFRPVRDQALLERTCRHHGIRRPFAFYLGNLEPRKNLGRLLRAFKQARRNLGGGVQLVISGQEAWLMDQVRQQLGELPPEDEVIFTGYLPQEELPVLMSAAQVFVFPSLYEGFGLPVLEAMSCGAAVITSNLSSLPEVAGQAALLVDPLDEQALAAALERVLGDDQERQRLAAAGLERARQFSPGRMARQTLQVYQRVLGAENGR